MTVNRGFGKTLILATVDKMELVESAYQPETRREVETLTGLDVREMEPKSEFAFLRCQIGLVGIRDGWPTFLLKAYGRIWAEAYEMWRRKWARAQNGNAS